MTDAVLLGIKTEITGTDRVFQADANHRQVSWSTDKTLITVMQRAPEEIETEPIPHMVSRTLKPAVLRVVMSNGRGFLTQAEAEVFARHLREAMPILVIWNAEAGDEWNDDGVADTLERMRR